MSYKYTNPPHTDKNEPITRFTKVNPLTGYYPSQKPDAVYYDEYLDKYNEYLASVRTGEIFGEEEEEEENEEVSEEQRKWASGQNWTR